MTKIAEAGIDAEIDKLSAQCIEIQSKEPHSVGGEVCKGNDVSRTG